MIKYRLFTVFLTTSLLLSCIETNKDPLELENINDTAISISSQGAFSIGGAIKTSDGVFDPIAHGAFNPTNQPTEGQTLHGDHASVLYQIPTNARSLPLIFWHGYDQ